MNPKSTLDAVMLHKPETSDKYGFATGDPEKIVHRRCRQCGDLMDKAGCETWQVANR